MKIYLAGKITGDENYREKFRKQEEQLQGEGHIVLSPARLPEGLKNEEYMRICAAMMSVADCVAFIPNWEESHGAQVEYAWCKYVGKPMMGLQREEEA
jgi:nucleoside 2-deoxyribosyltransferase